MSSVPSGTPAPGLDHEAALLGALLQRPALVLRPPTRAEHYERPIHAVVHQAITEVADLHGADAGVMHVVEALRRRTDIPNLMPQLRNGTLLTDYISWSDVAGGQPRWHAERVLEAWLRRHVRSLGIHPRRARRCPHCDEPVALGDLLDTPQPTTMD